MDSRGEPGLPQAPKAEGASARRKTKGQTGDCCLEAPRSAVVDRLTTELERLKKKAGMGYEVRVEWRPGELKYEDSRELAEEVRGDVIFIYAQREEEALQLVRHGFAEWLLNQYSKPYRQLVNSFIRLFEEQQYERKEKIVEALKTDGMKRT